MFTNKFKLSVAATIVLASQVTSAAPPAKGMTLWLDASDSTTLFSDKGCGTVTAVGSGVSCWGDKSGKNNNVTVALNVEANPPTLKGKAVHFNNTALVTSNMKQITPGTSYTKFVVFKLDNNEGLKTGPLAKHNLIGSAPYQTTLWADSGKLHSSHAGIKTNYLDSKVTLGTEKTHIGVTRFSKPDDVKNPDNAIHNILNLNGIREDFNDDAEKDIDNKPTPHKAAHTSIGGVGTKKPGEIYFPLEGQISEAIVYDRALTNTEISNTEKYLAKKWGLKLGQNITFDKLKPQVKGNPAIQLHAISSSGTKVVFTSITKGICKITSPGYVSLDAVGTCQIEANAAKSADGSYPKATPAVQSFEIKAVKDTSTEAPNTNPPKSSGGGGGSPLPFGLALLGFLAFIRRKLAQK